MATVLANMLHTRAFQLGAGFFCAAVIVANVDVQSLVVRNEPFKPSRASSSPIDTMITKPASRLLELSTKPAKMADYEPTTSFLKPSAVKSVYILDHVLDRPTVEAPYPRASAQTPQLPRLTGTAPVRISTNISGTIRLHGFPVANASSGDPIYSTDQPLRRSHWILNSFKGVLVEIKTHILANFSGMVPPFSMVAWYQMRYIQYLRRIATLESFKFIELKLAGQTFAKDREISRLQMELEVSFNATEAAVAEKQKSEQKANSEILRLQSFIVDGERALGNEQQRSKNELRKLGKDRDRLESTVQDKDRAVEREKETSARALQKVKDAASTEVGRLKQLVTEKNDEARRRRQADKSIIDNLEKQSASDAKVITSLQKEVDKIAQKDQLMTIMTADTLRLKKELATLTKDKERLLKNRADEKVADTVSKAQLKAQVEEAIRKYEAAKADASTQKNVATEARGHTKAAKEQAIQAERRASESAELAKASKQEISQLRSQIEALKNTLAEKDIFVNKAAFDVEDANQRAQDAEEGQRKSEEAARRAKGEANHLVKSQAGQLHRLKTLNDAYRAIYGKLDDAPAGDTTTEAAPSTTSSPSTCDVKSACTDSPMATKASEYTRQSSFTPKITSSQPSAASVSLSFPHNTSLES